MGWVALKMLTGDRAKYLGLVFGVAFASMLMSHQVSIFCGWENSGFFIDAFRADRAQ